jgi:hypothetical protein
LVAGAHSEGTRALSRRSICGREGVPRGARAFPGRPREVPSLGRQRPPYQVVPAVPWPRIRPEKESPATSSPNGGLGTAKHVLACPPSPAHSDNTPLDGAAPVGSPGGGEEEEVFSPTAGTDPVSRTDCGRIQLRDSCRSTHSATPATKKLGTGIAACTG